ncbi:MAG: hypothetical protein QOE11_1500 [Solirubrobacteraceae bacterium]|jgi:hypothetical protein|nr:hypothetical protein [Solirubrobacteraceae bacterium]
MDDDAIRVLVRRLARPHPSGGTVIERAAIVAEGIGSDDVMTWILAHGGTPEAVVTKSSARRGLHGLNTDAVGAAEARSPSRFVLPAGALDQT